MKVLYLGDVVGRAGREVVVQQVPELRRRLDLDFVAVNGENAAGGFGITDEICAEFFAAGADVVLTGNHAFDQRESIPTYDLEPRLLRPQNYPKSAPGRGVALFAAARGQRVLVIHVMTRLFMDPLDDPFACVDAALDACQLGRDADFILLDIHGEATSEKMALAHFVDGRVSLAAGTHTHVPTADAQILPGGTAYLSDIGMCGDYDSVIGMEKELAVERFQRKMPTARLRPAQGPATLCAVYVESDDRTGLARHVAPLRLGGRLPPAWPV